MPEGLQASYLSCAAQTHAVLREAAQPLQVCSESARGKQLQQQWRALVCAVDCVLDSRDINDAAPRLRIAKQCTPRVEVTETMPHVPLDELPPARDIAGEAHDNV